MPLKKVSEYIRRNKRFLITTHTSPEGDALGSQLAFYMLLKKMGKFALMVNEDIVPDEYNFLPGANKIQRVRKSLAKFKFDCFVTLDCSDLKRCGKASIFSINKPVVNIDHHISNARFADVNCVDAKASSAAEIVYRLYKQLRIPLNKDIATCLYVGILTDSGSFHYSNTTSLTHKIASHLLKFGLDSAKIYKKIYQSIPFRDIQLLTRILPNLKVQFDGKVAWLGLEKSSLKNTKISIDLTEQILSFARNIKDVEVVVLFKENLKTKNEIRVNFRSQGKIDVNKIAGFFGGGGHKTASGATVKGSLGQVSKKVLAKIKESL
ncbi:MAG: hypothetical protein A2166_04725 [Omnitrophica WOR_2 bacterium RBG_13_41_10]|nr:MAG: hypothetical protein A2166_04725 [Omnitrophica WOR_2 bacterium RBG_13_41_10]